jgi:crotonobetainyl-CoA:carnitine CoA-transferase CaiB-like acyl-CoA transferase
MSEPTVLPGAADPAADGLARGLAGPLVGLRVVELASEHGALAGKMLADLGAEVVLVEPPGGHPTRGLGPFRDDRPDPEGSLWWWHYHTSKLGVVLDLQSPQGLDDLRRLVAHADVVLEGEPPDRLGALGFDHPQARAADPRLIWVSITAFGRDPALPRRDEPFTDMTILAGGGPVWSCGYDDHSMPPVRGGGNQGWHTGCLWAVMGALAAVLQRDVSGRGQHVDVSLHAAANVTTEAGSYEWLVARDTVQRQTGRHAAVVPTRFTRMVASDGRDVNTGFPPRNPKEMQVVVDWLDELGLRDEFPDVVLLEIGIERGGVQLSEVGQDDLATEIYGSGRDALMLIASKLTGHEFFVGAQERGLPCSVINAPEEAFDDEHFRARGFAVEVPHPELGRSFAYPGAPYKLPASPWRITRRAPRLGEHTAEVLDGLSGGARAGDERVGD